MESERAPRPPMSLGFVLLVLWALLFVCAAVGELLEVDALRSFTDLKRIFLR